MVDVLTTQPSIKGNITIRTLVFECNEEQKIIHMSNRKKRGVEGYRGLSDMGMKREEGYRSVKAIKVFGVNILYTAPPPLSALPSNPRLAGSHLRPFFPSRRSGCNDWPSFHSGRPQSLHCLQDVSSSSIGVWDQNLFLSGPMMKLDTIWMYYRTGSWIMMSMTGMIRAMIHAYIGVIKLSMDRMGVWSIRVIEGLRGIAFFVTAILFAAMFKRQGSDGRRVDEGRLRVLRSVRSIGENTITMGRRRRGRVLGCRRPGNKSGGSDKFSEDAKFHSNVSLDPNSQTKFPKIPFTGHYSNPNHPFRIDPICKQIETRGVSI